MDNNEKRYIAEAIEVASWVETMRFGRVGHEIAEAVIEAALPSLRAGIEAELRQAITSELAAGREQVQS